MESKPRILVAVDFTESSDLAVAEARVLARKLKARIDFAHVSPPLVSPSEVMTREPADMRDAEWARDHLAALAKRTTAEGIEAEPHLRVGTVVMGLLDAIEQLRPTLVVVGSHVRGAITRALVGSVAESLVRRSPVPVLVVPSPRRRRAAAEAAWSCRECGHILGASESTSRCAHCHANPAHWISAPLSHEPIDLGEPRVGDRDRETIGQSRENAPTGLFATSPGGASGEVSINPELRIRY